MPESYVPANNNITVMVPVDDEPADGPRAFRDFADSMPILANEPVPVSYRNADFTAAFADMSRLHVMDTSGGSINVTVPLDDGTILPGYAFAVCNIGSDDTAVVILKAAAGVSLQNRALVQIPLYATSVVLKIDTNSWLISTGGVPAP